MASWFSIKSFSVWWGIVFFVLLSLVESCHRDKAQINHYVNPVNIDSLSEGSMDDLLQWVPPLLSSFSNHDSNTSIILTTADVARFDGRTEAKPYVNTVQIVDADAPWPPRWYASTAYFSPEVFNEYEQAKQYRFDFLIDAKVHAGHFSLYKIRSKQAKGIGQLVDPEFAGYVLLNEKMEITDTVRSKLNGLNMYFHDLRLNERNERMVDTKKSIYLNLTSYTCNAKDTAVHCNVDYIQILDTNNNLLFNWDPMKHLDPNIFQFKETLKGRAFASRHAEIVEWTRLTSALWDYDGNILYAMKKIGIGKFSRTDGHIMWQINYSDLPIVSGKDTIEWFDPHDFNLLHDNGSTVTYSIYSNGEGNKPARGVLFDMDKKTQRVTLVKYIDLKTRYLADGQGNMDYSPNGDYAVGYGFFEKSDTSTTKNYRPVLEYSRHDGSYGVYQLPKCIYTYKAHLLQNWPKPPRPVIVKESVLLKAIGEFQDYTWYKLSGKDNLAIEKAGQGNSIKAEKGATYCVEGKYGIGFSVSRPIVN